METLELKEGSIIFASQAPTLGFQKFSKNISYFWKK
jgi:hypothetical protein